MQMYEIFILGGQTKRGLIFFHFVCPATFQGNLAHNRFERCFFMGVQTGLRGTIGQVLFSKEPPENRQKSSQWNTQNHPKDSIKG